MTGDKKRRAGQSLIEMALALPIMLIMISGLIEFGFALNQYLNALDAAREAARFATDSDPLDRDYLPGGGTNQDCGSTLDFYMQAACIAVQTMAPVDFDPTQDDVVISAFRVLSGTVIGRWPNCEPADPDDCPNDPPNYPETMGEWHLYGRGDACGNFRDDDFDGFEDDGCPGSPNGVVGEAEYCNSRTDRTCHPSRLTEAIVQSKLNPDAPDSAVLLVEIFYNYPHVMQLPWITPFVPNPLPLHTYTILPLPAAEPSLTITGTVMMEQTTGDDDDDGGGGSVTWVPAPGVTVHFGNGMIAITDSSGQYVRTGLSSGAYILTVDTSGTNCNVVSPPQHTVTLGINNVYDVNFDLSDCVDVAATNVAATSTSAAATGVAGTATQDAATATSAAATSAAGTATAGATATSAATATATATATISPLCNPTIVSDTFSQVTIFSPDPPLAQADGASSIEVLVTVVNECGTAATMNDKTVTLSSSRGGQDTIAPASVQSDINGQASFFVTSDEMSNWDSSARAFDQSTFTAVAGGVTILDTASGAFACVGGLEGTAVNGDEVVWRFQNDSGINRRLIQIDVSWSQPEDPSRKLLDVQLDGVTIWSSASYFFNPAMIGSGDWTGAPNDRHLDAGAIKDLQLTYNFSVTGSQSFTLVAQWDNTSGTSVCTSNSVTIVR